jgi:hypothetical protein
VTLWKKISITPHCPLFLRSGKLQNVAPKPLTSRSWTSPSGQISFLDFRTMWVSWEDRTGLW